MSTKDARIFKQARVAGSDIEVLSTGHDLTLLYYLIYADDKTIIIVTSNMNRRHTGTCSSPGISFQRHALITHGLK